jgi:parvulin-like peptidyl-prolyl isomerase
VNGVPITRGEYYQRVLRKFGTRTVLSGIIKEELFLQEARRLGLTVTSQEVEAKVEDLLAQEKGQAGGEAALAAIYRQQGLSLDDVRRDYARDVESHLLVAKVTRAMRNIDEAALREYYAQTYARTRYRVRHIPYAYPLRGFGPEEAARLKLMAREKAARTARRIREGADFAQIARKESEDSTRESGGEIGYLSEDMEMDPVMKEVVFRLKPGEVSDPVENGQFGAYHVVQVTEVVPHRSYAECEERMRQELAAREPDLKEIQEAVSLLWGRATIRALGEEAPPVPPGPGGMGGS